MEKLETDRRNNYAIALSRACLLRVLGRARGERAKAGHDHIPDSVATGSHRRLRSFLNSLAYICAWEKKPGYVTSVAIEKLPEAVVAWMAANNGIEDGVVRFAQQILDRVYEASQAYGERHVDRLETVKNEVLSTIIHSNHPRIRAYQTAAKKVYQDGCAPVIEGWIEEASEY